MISAIRKRIRAAESWTAKGKELSELAEKTLKAIETCADKHDCNGCPYDSLEDCYERLLMDCKKLISRESEYYIANEEKS